MGRRDSWKTLKPEEQVLQLIRTVNDLQDRARLYTRIQGIRLESRMVIGERHLFAVVDDATATNNGAAYQLTP